ncbi:hypothetical protein OS965_02375 [Streptomyces sp. H27-G5]|uniref:hypothetical protein n=1 Tax=Streptomyces sp. H27-G5 TaxID=2996698 RepID=UPI002270A53E|nr:hypothetical protein [Streptomyces sp. H27-G5]MCY0917022.1 hypothetical protein [Streptomyces sp. H27-G5]
MIEAVVSSAAGGACAGSAALLYYSEKLPGIKKLTNKLHTDRAQAILIATASAAVISTPAGSWWNDTVNSLHGWSVGMVGQWTGLLITGIPALFVTVIFINDLWTRKVEHRTRILGALLPILVSTIPGPIGSGIQSALSWIVGTVSSLVAGAFGLG